jgi:predicted transcriptional regulator
MKYGEFPQFHQIRQPVLDLVRAHPYEPSQETVKTLIQALLEKEGKWNEWGN